MFMRKMDDEGTKLTVLKDVGKNTIANTFAILFPGEAIFLTTVGFEAITSVDKKDGKVHRIQVWNDMSKT